MTIVTPWARLRSALRAEGWFLVPLRVLVGFGFAAHGYAKLERGPAAFADIVASLGLPAPLATAWITTLFELGGGLSILFGAGVAPISVPLAVIMWTAWLGVHARYGFSSVRLKSMGAAGAVFGPVGYEINLLYISALIALALGGSTPLSIDRWLEKRGNKQWTLPTR